MNPRLISLALCSLLLALSLSACRSKEARPEAYGSRNELSVEEFRALLAEGTLKPVTSMEPDPFDDLPFADPERVDLEPEAAAESGELGTASGESEEIFDLPDPVIAMNPYVEFGDRIIVYPDGRIAKMYPLRTGTGVKMQELLDVYAPFPVWTKFGDAEPPSPMPEDKTSVVRVDLHTGWDIELVTDLRKPVPDEGIALSLADWLVVSAVPELLREVEDFINTFAAGVPQIEVEAKIVEVTTTNSLSLGVGQVDDTTPIAALDGGALLDSVGWNFPVAGGASATLGAIQDGTSFAARVEALAKYENVSIISRPKVAVREGGRARIVNTTEVPFFNITGISSSSGQFGASLTFKEVGVQLYVVPRVVGTETIALNIDVEVSQQSGTAVTFSTGVGDEVSNPILSKRAASTIVYLEPGQAVILGGLITERLVDTEDKIPLLGDIPLLGHLFKRTVTVKEQTNVLFFIRPRILQGADVNREF